MEKQLKDLCIRAGQGENLEACLNGYTKPQIRRILDVYGRKAVSSAKKQELIDAAEEAVRENAIAWLEKEENEADRTILREISAQPVHISDIGEFSRIERLYERGMVFLTESDGKAQTLVPVNMVAILDSMDAGEKKKGTHPFPAREPKAADRNRTESETEIIRYAKALSNIYGMFSLSQLKDVWDINHNRGIAPSAVREAVAKAGEEDGFYVRDDMVVNTVLDEADCEKIREKYVAGDTYYYPSPEVIRDYEEGPRMADAPEYTYILSYLGRKTSEEKAEQIMRELCRMALTDASASELVEYLSQEEITFLNLDELNRFLLLYTGWFYEIRVWVCKGYKPCELTAERLQMRNFNLSPGYSPKSRRKVGRNDSCPCGSGKKYKNCCMKKIENR